MDSGDITDETTVMGIPCITLRDSTELPETAENGTNELLVTNPETIIPTYNKLFTGEWKEPTFLNVGIVRPLNELSKLCFSRMNVDSLSSIQIIQPSQY